MNSPSYCLQKMLWQYTYEIYINTLIAIIYFLSKHHLQGGDREQHSKTIALVISIHTTRKVVTKDPRGTIIAKLFQSTPPARWWQCSITVHIRINFNFNPHHPQGGDGLTVYARMITSRISIHTTRKVVTMYALSIMGLKYISIHTTRKVVTIRLPY